MWVQIPDFLLSEVTMPTQLQQNEDIYTFLFPFNLANILGLSSLVFIVLWVKDLHKLLW